MTSKEVSREYKDGLYQVTVQMSDGRLLTGFSLNSYAAALKDAQEGAALINE